MLHFVIAMLMQWRPRHMVPGDHMGWGGWTLMLLFWLIVLALIVWLVATLIRRARGEGPRAGPDEDRAEAVLRERYARGEIDEETYRRQLDELRGS